MDEKEDMYEYYKSLSNFPLCMKLRKMRTRINFTQKQLANKLGVGRITVSQWEIGKASPNQLNFEKIIKFYGLPPHIFVSECVLT